MNYYPEFKNFNYNDMNMYNMKNTFNNNTYNKQNDSVEKYDFKHHLFATISQVPVHCIIINLYNFFFAVTAES